MVEVRLPCKLKNTIKAVVEVRVAGHPRNATEHVWSTCVDDAAEARKRQKPKAQ